MKQFLKYLPAASVIALTTTAALAQIGPGAAPRPGRTPPTAQQIAARQAQFCTDLKARAAARDTYIEQRLNLTAAQKPLFDRWKAARDSVAQGRLADCGKAQAPTADARQRPTLPERNARREEMLKQQLAALQKTSGPEEALYKALTPEQQQLFDGQGGMRMGMRGGARFMGGGGMMHGRFMGGPGERMGRGMRGGPMPGPGMPGPGPRGRGGPDAMPPAPPAPAR